MGSPTDEEGLAGKETKSVGAVTFLSREVGLLITALALKVKRPWPQICASWSGLGKCDESPFLAYPP